MAKTMRPAAMICFAAAVVTALLYYFFDAGIFLTLAITFGTTAYHLGMRLIVGQIFNSTMKNRADYTKKWYRLRPWENKLYRFLKVKAWKNKMPTYYPETFSPEKHSWSEIAGAMCQSELVHEVNVILSFPPLIASVWFGSFFVFLITSIGSAMFDMIFVIMQRYNRARVVKTAMRQSSRAAR